MRIRRFVPGVVAALVLAVLLDGSASAAPGAGGATTAPASARSVGGGSRVVAQGLDQPPELTPEQRAQRDAAMARADRSGPTNLPRAVQRAPGVSAGPQQPAPGMVQAATDLVFTDSIPAGIPAGKASFVQEPSGDSAGVNLFQTGNWYAIRSFNRGATWTALNPFAMFGAGFCCDQVAIYDPGRNRWFWLLQFSDHLVLANSGDLVNWCFYNWFPASFGFTGSLDFNDLALGTNDVYIASNVFPSAGGAGATLVRLPIDPQIACAGFGYNFFTRTDLGFTWRPVSGAYDVMYWGTDWAGTLGSFFRVFRWAENSGSISWADRSITAFSFFTRNSGQNCGSADGVVTNWCQFSDSRVLGAARYTDPGGTARLVFAFGARQGGPFNLPFPYVERANFRESDLAYLGSDRVWASWAAFQFPSMSTDARGHVGMTMIFGGGAGGSHHYPSGSVFLQDDVSPNQPWQRADHALGGGNTCTYGGLVRYGDYMTTRPLRPTNLSFVGLDYVIANANCGSAGSVNQPHRVVFGRSRDLPGAVNRWS